VRYIGPPLVCKVCSVRRAALWANAEPLCGKCFSWFGREMKRLKR